MIHESATTAKSMDALYHLDRQGRCAGPGNFHEADGSRRATGKHGDVFFSRNRLQGSVGGRSMPYGVHQGYADLRTG